MNILDIINEIEFSERLSEDYILKNDLDKTCCVCFTDNYFIYDLKNECILSLSDIEPSFFKNDEIPKSLLVKSCCNVHYICINCIHRLINNYEAHPINESNSHLSCPYPFGDCVTSIGFKNIFDHNLIKKICNDTEWENYRIHSENFSFPGFTIIKCPVYYYRGITRVLCNTEILLENETIKNTQIGDFIVECTQNANCLKRFCFNCHQTMSYYQQVCHDCKTNHENENPNLLNYYFNKNTSEILSSIASTSIETNNDNGDNDTDNGDNDTDNGEVESKTVIINYNENSYLYLNKEITIEIAVEQIMNIIKNIDTFFICSICKISLYKTERCNGLSHHNVERCYACGRIGYKTKGLGEHWNPSGHSGCFRFNSDLYIKTTIPHYLCNDSICSNHEKGDCTVQEHKLGIEDLEHLRKRSYVYHSIKSLLPEIRFDVYDELYDKLSMYPELLQYMPYKQTLMLLTTYKSRYKDFSESIVYKNLNCYEPSSCPKYTQINFCMDTESYLLEFSILPPQYNANENTITNNNSDNNIITTQIPVVENVINLIENTTEIQIETNNNIEISSWRRLLEQELSIPLIRRRILHHRSSDEEDNLSFDSTSGLLVNNSDTTSNNILIQDNITWTQNVIEEYTPLQNEQIDNLTSYIFDELLNELITVDNTTRENSLHMYQNVIEYISPTTHDQNTNGHPLNYDPLNYQVTHDYDQLNTPNLIITSNSMLINFLSDDDTDTEVDNDN